MKSMTFDICCCSVTVMSNFLWSHELQYTRLPCPSSFPRVCANSCPLCWGCHPTITFSVTPCSSCLQSFPASRFFLMSHLLASGSQSIGASASSSALPMNIQDWFPLGLTDLISLESKGLWRVFFNTNSKASISSVLSLLYSPTLTSIHDWWKNCSFDCCC